MKKEIEKYSLATEEISDENVDFHEVEIPEEEDIINTVDNKEINTMNDLREYIYTKNVGDAVELNITRGKVNKVVKVVLRKKVT